MTIHPVSEEAPPPSATGRPHVTPQAQSDTSSVYDTTWTEQPDSQAAEGLNRIMGADGKIYVVLAVVLIIWFGLMALLFRTDRKIDQLEQQVHAQQADDQENL